MSRRARLAVAAAPAAALILAPAAAEAHGLVQRTNLPIPEWLFGWAAAIVLVASFAGLAVLWPAPRLQEPAAYRDALRAIPRAREIPLAPPCRAVLVPASCNESR